MTDGHEHMTDGHEHTSASGTTALPSSTSWTWRARPPPALTGMTSITRSCRPRSQLWPSRPLGEPRTRAPACR